MKQFTDARVTTQQLKETLHAIVCIRTRRGSRLLRCVKHARQRRRNSPGTRNTGRSGPGLDPSDQATATPTCCYLIKHSGCSMRKKAQLEPIIPLKLRSKVLAVSISSQSNKTKSQIQDARQHVFSELHRMSGGQLTRHVENLAEICKYLSLCYTFR